MDTSFQRLRRFLSWHRRSLAALLAGLATFALAQQLAPEPGDRLPVVVLSDAVEPGTKLSASLLRLTELPASAVPAESFPDPTELLGRTVGFGLAAGTILQPGMLANSPKLAPGRCLVPILIHDDALRQLLTPGSLVTLVLAETSEVVTPDARVAGVPSEANGGTFEVRSGQPLLLVDVPAEIGPSVAALGQSGQLSVLLGGG